MRTGLVSLGVSALALLAALPAAAKTDPKKKDGPAIRWSHTYAAALEEAKERGCVVFATFHAEHWGACVSQHQLVLDNEDFATWTNENCLCCVGHNGAVGGKEDHKPAEETDAKTKEKHAICPLYHGLTCEEHQQVKADAGNPKDGYGKIDFPNGVPNSWMIGPDGVVKQMDQKASMSPKSAIEALTAFQAGYKDKPVGAKKYEAYKKLFADADKAIEASKFKDALAAYAKVDADAKKLSPGLVARVKSSVEALNEKAKAKFDELTAADGDVAAKLKSVRQLRADVGAKLSTGTLAVLVDIDAWIKEQAAAAAAPAGMQ